MLFFLKKNLLKGLLKDYLFAFGGFFSKSKNSLEDVGGVERARKCVEEILKLL